MARLSAAELDDRLRLDERTMALVNVHPAPVRVTAHLTAADARSGANAVPPGLTDDPPEHYRVTFDFDTKRDRKSLMRPTIVHIDLTANGNYPFSEPVCRVVGGSTPWTPHFHEVWPICIGDGWRHDGKALAVDLTVHIAKLLNFDEPPPRPGYHGWNGEAIEWWRGKQSCKPLNPNLVYPLVDPNQSAGVNGPRFAGAAGGAARFAPSDGVPEFGRARFTPSETNAAPRFAARRAES